jgi:DNA-binding transcriptional MerR regulator
MSDTSELLKIGDFARIADTNLRTLRYYEELGLITPASRSTGGFRYYRRTDVNRVNMIRDLQVLGLPLERIRALLVARGQEAAREGFFTQVAAALHEHDRLLQAKMKELDEQRQKVAQALDKLHDCRSCTHMPGPGNNHCEPCLTTGRSLPQQLSALY